jgi:ketopantoate reductase
MALKPARYTLHAQRMAGAQKVAEHKTSVLEDPEVRRPIEFEARAGRRRCRARGASKSSCAKQPNGV